MKLIVINPFLSFAQGDEIKDPVLIKSILSSDSESNVVKVATPESFVIDPTAAEKERK